MCIMSNAHEPCQLRKIPENTITRRADVSAMRRAIDSNTIAIVGSCPQVRAGLL
jgi:glutamate/tyrosine decarboxylase-like PLP-dependent enzyme